MSEKKSKRLEVVVDIAQRQVDEAATLFQKAQAQYELECQKLDELNGYYQEYQVSFEAQSRGLSGECIARQRYFLAKIAEARRSQEALIERSAIVVEERKDQWQKLHLKFRAMQDLVARIKQDEVKVLDRKEEKMLDEWVQQSVSRSALYM